MYSSIYLKRFLIVFSLITFLMFSYNSQRASAVLPAAPAIAIGGAEATISTGACVALIGTSLVATGTMLDAKYNDGDVCKYIAGNLIAAGNSAQLVGSQISATGQTFLTWTKDGVEWLKSQVTAAITNGIPIASSGVGTRSLSLSSGTVITWTYGDSKSTVVTVPYSGQYNVTTRLVNTNTYSISVSQVGGQGFGSGTVIASNTVPTSSIVGSSGAVATTLPLNPSLMKTNVSNFDTMGKDVTLGDGSICYRPNYGIPVTAGEVDSTGSIPAVPAIDIPYGKTLPDITGDIGITYPNTNTGSIDVPTTTNPDTTGSIDTGKGIMNIPILGDILKFLEKIFNLLKDFIGSLAKWFTIDWAQVKTHINYIDIVKTHLKPIYDIFDTISNMEGSISDNGGKFYMVIPPEMGGDGNEHCVLDLTVASVHISTARNVIKYGMWICFVWYILKRFDIHFSI